MKSLHIDIGSTSIKWACYAGGSGKTAVRKVPFPPPSCSEAPFYEVNQESIWQIVCTIIDAAQPIDRMYCSVQMHGYVLGDAEGQAVTPYISWQDERASLPVRGSTYLDQYPHPVEPWTGSSRKANLPAISLFAMQDLFPALLRRAKVFYTLGSYLAYRLTGHNNTHLSDAAATGFYDIRSGQAGRLAPAGLQIPITRDMNQPVGYYRKIAVYPPVGDQQAAVLGCDLQTDAYLLNLGTAAQLCTIEATRCLGDYESRPFFDGRTLCTVTRLLGGRDINRMLHDAQLVDKLAADYSQAIARLPVRSHLLAVGGAAQYHRTLIGRVCSRLGMPCAIDTATDALDGLISLTRGEKAYV